MIRFRQQIPVQIVGFDPFIINAPDTAALLADPRIAIWAQPAPLPNHPQPLPFYRYSVNDHRLIAEYDEGRLVWVIGTVSGAPLDLPEWTPITAIPR